MRRILGLLQFREAILAAGPAVLIALVIVLAAFWFAAQFIAPAPPREMVIAAAAKGSPYYQAAQRYRDVLAESGVALKILETKGSVENLALITDPQSKVAAAFLQGGLANSREAPDLRSIGRVFYEPVWVFYQGSAKLERLADLAGKRIAVIGAGGAARAIVAGLAAYGATVVIYNRTEERAAALAADFNGHTGKVVAAPWGKLCSACCDAYINCTPLGMHPHIDASPIVGDPAWTPDTVVFDTVYNPLSTKFLQLAETKGAKTIPGTEMFIRQAAVQFEAFTGQPAPIDVFRKVLLEKLSVAD